MKQRVRVGLLMMMTMTMMTACTDSSSDQAICGEGTVLQGDMCVAAGPGADPLARTCGNGTHQEGTVCFANDVTLSCGPGTHRDGNLCLPDRPLLSCGPGTHREGNLCLPDGSGITCGPGTHQEGNVCLPDGTQVICGPGTHQDGDVCLPDVACGPGTHQDGGVCVPTEQASYELRVSSSAVAADGRTKLPVLLIGTLLDGSPATDPVVLTTDRASAGSFVNPQVTLSALGTIALFVPCNATTPGCTGAVRLSLALASAPETEVAHLDVTLVEPTGVADASLCMTASKAMHLDGNDFIFNGIMTVTEGAFTGTGAADLLHVHVVPSQPAQGAFWDLAFDSKHLGTPLVPGVYENAMRQPFATDGHPGLEVVGNFHGCNTISGRFQVHFFELVPGQQTVSRALISFEQHCEGGPLLLSGCIHVE